MTNLIPVLVAIAVAIAANLQGQISGILERKFGVFDSILVIYLGGGLLILAIAIFRTFFGSYSWSNYLSLPWYSILAGASGLVIVGGIAYCVSRLGLTATFGLIITFQFFLASVLDSYGIGLEPRPMNLSRFLGVGLLMAGSLLFLK